jgi:hypothetical protein
MLHIDLFYEISLRCKPYILSVNKELNLLYSDDWFLIKLNNLFPGRKLFTVIDYKDLYKRYLAEGDIYCSHENINKKLLVRGIKARHGYTFINKLYKYILTFNGELYLQEKDEVTLVDTEVVDIASFNNYIKNNKAYVDNKELNFHERLLKIKSNWTDTYILSINGLYIISCNETHFIPMKDCVNFTNVNGIGIIDKHNNYYDICDNKLRLRTGIKTFVPSTIIKQIFTVNGPFTLNKKNELIGCSGILEESIKDIMVDDYTSSIWYYIK